MNFSPGDFQRKIGTPLNFTLVAGAYVVINGAPANGDKQTLKFAADAGHYDMTFRFATESDAGIVETHVDGVLLDTFDAYTGGAPAIETRSLANVALVSGDHEIEFSVNGKNGASAGFACYHAWANIVPV